MMSEQANKMTTYAAQRSTHHNERRKPIKAKQVCTTWSCYYCGTKFRWYPIKRGEAEFFLAIHLQHIYSAEKLYAWLFSCTVCSSASMWMTEALMIFSTDLTAGSWDHTDKWNLSAIQVILTWWRVCYPHS